MAQLLLTKNDTNVDILGIMYFDDVKFYYHSNIKHAQNTAKYTKINSILFRNFT